MNRGLVKFHFGRRAKRQQFATNRLLREISIVSDDTGVCLDAHVLSLRIAGFAAGEDHRFERLVGETVDNS